MIIGKYSEFIRRFKKLANIKEDLGEPYFIKITLTKGLVAESLNEHNVYNNFPKSTRRYMYHPDSTNPPAKAHCQVYPPNSKKEIYVVCKADGKAHHRKNEGYLVSTKEADELRTLEVKLPTDNILETLLIDNKVLSNTAFLGR